MADQPDEVLIATALFDRIASAGIPLHKPPYAINVGCHDGKSLNDPVYPLFVRGFSGLAIDGGRPPQLAENLKDFPVVLRTSTWIYPENVASILREAGCPPNPEFLKIDVDGIDAPILRAILEAGIRPLAVQIELNSEIPPPFAFSVCSHEKYSPGGREGFFGCSLSYAVDSGEPVRLCAGGPRF